MLRCTVEMKLRLIVLDGDLFSRFSAGRQPGSSQSASHERCANPKCWYRASQEQGGGGFCCRKCHWRHAAWSQKMLCACDKTAHTLFPAARSLASSLARIMTRQHFDALSATVPALKVSQECLKIDASYDAPIAAPTAPADDYVSTAEAQVPESCFPAVAVRIDHNGNVMLRL